MHLRPPHACSTKSRYGPSRVQFEFTLSLVLVQCLANAVFARLTRGARAHIDTVPNSMYAFASISYLLAMMASNYSLQFIPYPTQVTCLFHVST